VLLWCGKQATVQAVRGTAGVRGGTGSGVSTGEFGARGKVKTKIALGGE
jgi:hypothetical protein